MLITGEIQNIQEGKKIEISTKTHFNGSCNENKHLNPEKGTLPPNNQIRPQSQGGKKGEGEMAKAESFQLGA